MYVPAFDFNQGLVPYKQIFIAYGYLTTWIQAVSLTVLGNSLKSIGIVTGLSYSLSLFLSYRVFLAFLSKPLSAFSVLLIFLIHPYIVHPWPNYFSYTLQLICLLLFIKARTIAVNRFAAGVCLGLACLFRYSSAVAIVPPFLIYLGYEAFLIDTRGATEGERRSTVRPWASRASSLVRWPLDIQKNCGGNFLAESNRPDNKGEGDTGVQGRFCQAVVEGYAMVCAAGGNEAVHLCSRYAERTMSPRGCPRVQEKASPQWFDGAGLLCVRRAESYVVQVGPENSRRISPILRTPTFLAPPDRGEESANHSGCNPYAQKSTRYLLVNSSASSIAGGVQPRRTRFVLEAILKVCLESIAVQTPWCLTAL